MKTIEELRQFLNDTFKENDIYLFGSRAKGLHKRYSDIDIAIDGKIKDKTTLTKVKLILEESNLPYKVDLIHLENKMYLKNIIKQEGIKWN